MVYRISALSLLLSLVSVSQLLLAAPPMSSEKTSEGVLILEEGKPVLFFQKIPKSINGQYERSNYIHPLYNLDGDVITEDFPEDHLHQRGIFWTWHQIAEGDARLGDGWECRDIRWEVLSAEAEPGAGGQAVLKTKVHWKSPNLADETGNMIPFVEETAKITVYPAASDSRNIDFEITLLALREDIFIGGSEDEKGYGGFSPRIFLPEDVSFSGVEGTVVPETEAVSAGPVIDITGSFRENQRGGIAIIQHPSNPDFPQQWILREKNSMQNPVYPGRDKVRISNTKPLILRYRLVLHGAEIQDLKELLSHYSEIN